MTRVELRVAAILSGVVVFATPGATQQPQFRAATDVVAVDVSVHQGGGPVRGLVAADFRVVDNGVPQRVDAVEASAMPVDVTLIVDVSTGTRGAGTGSMSSDWVLAQLRRNVTEMAGILRPGDRVRLLTSDTYINQALAMTPIPMPGVRAFSTPVETLGLASTYDALATAMMRADEPERRHLIVAWVKPVDTISHTDATVIRELSRATGAVVHVIERDVLTPPPPSSTVASEYSPSGLERRRAADRANPTEEGAVPISRELPTPSIPRPPTAADLDVSDSNGGRYYARMWRPFARVEPALLPELASLTGGTYRGLGVFSDVSAAAAFARIFEDFRQGYTLRYRSEGVRREGIHEITVTVPARPDAEIRARRSYAVAASVTAPPSSPVAASVGVRRATPGPSSIDDLVELFAQGDDLRFPAALRQSPDLRRLIRDYRSSETPWPSNPHLDSILALQLSAAGLLFGDQGTRDDAAALMAQHFNLVRQPLGADRFECGWYRAALAAAQASYLAGMTLAASDRAIERCPHDGRLRLARAVALDQLWSLDTARDRSAETVTAQVDPVMVHRAYESVMADFPDAAPEARVRAAWAAYRTSQRDRALTLLDAVPLSSVDRPLDYFKHLIRAQVLRRQERYDEAAAAYRAALVAWPGAQSARVGLMTLLVERGARAESEALSEAIQSTDVNAIDPWWVYWQGDYRRFTEQIQNLREMAR